MKANCSGISNRWIDRRNGRDERLYQSANAAFTAAIRVAVAASWFFHKSRRTYCLCVAGTGPDDRGRNVDAHCRWRTGRYSLERPWVLALDQSAFLTLVF